MESTGYVRYKIATRLTLAAKWEIEAMLGIHGEKAMDAAPVDIHEYVDRAIARKRALRRPKRDACIPKWLRPRCDAKTRAGGTCKATPVWNKQDNRPVNGRCRMHGGLSTGPRTESGKRKALRNLMHYKGED